MDQKKLRKSISSYDQVYNPYNFTTVFSRPFSGDVQYNAGQVPVYSLYGQTLSFAPANYSEELAQCRFFYKFEPVASTVINRMAELAATELRLKREDCTEEEFEYFNGVLDKVECLIKSIALEYLIAGMAVPDYGQQRVMGNRLSPELGRKRYIVPDRLWVRNPENVILKRTPFGGGRRVYLKIPREEVDFILNKGVYADGTEDKDLYDMLVKEFPDYVDAIQKGKTQIPLPNVRPIFRNLSPAADYPQPFLMPALAAFKHKTRIREMDHSIATRAIEAIQLIKAGNDEYPVTEDDDTLDNLQSQMKARSANQNDQLVYKLYTNHTVSMEWIYPPLDALLSPAKYEAVDADIFMAMGFSRVLLVGESTKSNSGAGPAIVMGPLAMIEEMREKILEWIEGLFDEFKDLNNFVNTPCVYFTPLTMSDMSTLVVQASSAFKAGVISKNTYASFFGTDFETEFEQIEREAQRISTSDTVDQIVQLGQQPHTPPTTTQNVSPDGTVTEETNLPSDMLNINPPPLQ